MSSSGNNLQYLIIIILTINITNAINSTRRNFRLSDNIVPIHYDLEITPYMEKTDSENKTRFTFDGFVAIQLKSLKPSTNKIVLHAQNLTILETSLKTLDENNHRKILLDVKDVDPITDKLTILLKSPMISGEIYELSISYTGDIKNSDNERFGFFAKPYEDQNDQRKYVAVTHFEPTHARKALPCFDEPKFKSTFTVKINRSNKYKSYSNMKINFTIPLEEENRTIDVFKKTPIMPVYTLGFVVADYSERSQGDNFTILVPHKDINYTNIAYENTLNILKAFEEYTGIEYPDSMEHLQLIGVNGYQTAAMEHWGIVTFENHMLTCDLECDYEEPIVMLIAHELSHMWFGNLVTCEWWSYTWLNEGFARFFQFLIVEKLHPKWKLQNAFPIRITKYLFDLEYEEIYRPLTDRRVQTPEDSRDMFSLISYSKGGVFLSMLLNAFGPDKFQTAIRRYLSKNAYKTVTPDELLEALLEEWPYADIDFQQLFIDWTEQIGYPLITMSLSNDGKTVQISQEHFHSDTNEVQNRSLKWIVPISYTTNAECDFENTLPRVFLENQTLQLELNHAAKWIIGNIQQTGYYRINYDDEIWKQIGISIKSPNFGGIHILNRAKILHDLVTFSKIGLVNFETSLDLLEFLEHDTHPLVWTGLSFDFISRKLKGDDYKLFQIYVRKLITTIYEALDSDFKFSLRYDIERTSCESGVKSCLEKAFENFNIYLNGNDSVMQYDLFAAAVHYSSENYFENIFEKFKSDNRTVNIGYLACTTNKTKLLELLEYTFDKYAKDEPSLIDSITSLHCTMHDVVFDFILNNFHRICEVNCAEADLNKTIYRLLDSVIPLHYDLRITPHLSFENDENLFQFEGEVDIRVKVLELDANSFVLHSENLTITSMTLRDAETGEEILLTKNLPDSDNSDLAIFPRVLRQNGEYILSIQYHGIIRTEFNGLYHSSYKNDDNETIYIGVTHFQPSYARTAFPCFDEPKFKATFRVSINRHNNYKAYSNTKLSYSIPIEGTNRTMDVFKQTPKMSTYILAFIITDYEDRHINDNFTILVQSKQFQEADLAVNYSQILLDFFDEYTDIPYSSIEGIEKMDLIAIPDFNTAAMENWGLVTFSKYGLLCPSRCPEESKIYRVNNIAHEFAHMWFGNLVTCEWWSYTWLNEGFANYFSHYVLIEKVPNWNTELDFVVKVMGNAFQYDFSALKITNKDVNTAGDVKNMFSGIIYKKGSSVVRMFDHMMGQDSFKRAIRRYLRDNKYGTVTPDDLYMALRTEWHNSEVDLYEIFTDWTEQSGYPIITVALREGGRIGHIKQEQFYLNDSKRDNITRKWIIPLSFATNHDRNAKNTLPKAYLMKNGSQDIHLGPPSDWVVFNIRQSGYYRVNYDEETWLKLGHALRQENLSGIDVINRVQIVIDLFTYVEQNLVTYDILLEVLTYLKFENELKLWELAMPKFMEYFAQLPANDLRKYKKYIQPLLTRIYNEVKSEISSKNIEDNTKKNLAQMCCMLGVRECITKSREIVDMAILENSKLESDIDRMAFMVVISYDSEHYYDKIYDYVEGEFSPVEEKLTLFACTDDKNKLFNYLNLTIRKYNGTALIDQFQEILGVLCTNKQLTFDFIVQYFDTITENTSESKKEVFIGILSYLTTNADQIDILRNLGKNIENLEEALKDAEGSIRWHQDVGSKISRYLNERFLDENIVAARNSASKL